MFTVNTAGVKEIHELIIKENYALVLSVNLAKEFSINPIVVFPVCKANTKQNSLIMRINLSSAAFVFDKFPALFNDHTWTAKSTDHIFSNYLFVFSKSMNCSLFGFDLE